MGTCRAVRAARRRAALRLSDDDLEEFGYAPTDPPPDWEKTRTWTNARTGETARVPVGIDPGFQHNAGTISRKAFATPAPVAAEIARAEDVFEIPAFLRATPAPGGVRAGLVEDAVTSREFRERAPGYVRYEDLPGEAVGYFADDYAAVNDAMRAGRQPDTARLRAVVDDLKSAMTPLAEDVTVWRGRRSVKNHRIGEKIEDSAFTSTSASWRTAARFADYTGKGGGTVYRIRVPRGTRAVVENDGEQEIVFMPLQKFRVVDVIDGARDGANAGYAGPAESI